MKARICLPLMASLMVLALAGCAEQDRLPRQLRQPARQRMA